jgi:hypothetical protein
MSRRRSIALTHQLDELLSGIMPLDDASSELLQLLPVAAGIGLDESVRMPAASLSAGHAQLLAALAALPRERLGLALPAWLRTPALAGGLAAALSGGAIAYAAQGAPPDSPLYPVQQAVQAVTQSLPLLPPPAPTAIPSPTATAMPASVAPSADSAATSRPRDRAAAALGEAPTADPTATAVKRDEPGVSGTEPRHQDDDGGQVNATPTVTAGLRSNRGEGPRPFATQTESRGVKGDIRSSADTGSANGNGGDNENGRTGDRSARSNRGN